MALIPREVFFGNPERIAPRISPDGRHLAWLAPDEGVLNVWVAPTDAPDQARPVTKDRHRGIRVHGWAHNSRHLVYIQDKDGDENWHLYAVDLDSGEARDLTPIEGVAAQIIGGSADHPDELLVAINDREPSLHDPHRVSLVTGERTRLLENPGFVGWLSDRELNIRFGAAMQPDGSFVWMRYTGEGWEPFASYPSEDALSSGLSGFDEHGRLLALDSRGRETAALVVLEDPADPQTVAAHERADIQGIAQHPGTHAVQWVYADAERRERILLDDSVAGDLAALEAISAGDLEVVSRTHDDRHWVVAHLVDNGSTRYHLWNRDTRTASFLFTARPSLDELELARMHPLTLSARDGLPLVAYLSLPPGRDVDGRPPEPLPMVLVVHGGPWARDSWGYNAEHQWLANRGYAVLSVNFRGSTGLGKTLLNAGDLEWAGKMHDDLLDAVDWAVAEGVADPDKVAIFGGSYGGYAALVGLTFTPTRFACAVDIVGPSNLQSLIENIPPYWAPLRATFDIRVGNIDTEEGRALLRDRSPLHRVDAIERPLLIAQGANDPRVTQVESDQIVAAMQDKGIPVTYALFPDEGHGFARPENRFAFYALTESFLAKHLGGTSLPLGGFEGSSLTVPAGAEHLAGLADLLETP
ncbi:MAG: S9 family peptidase [Deltaproteobacteria bacterium]|nr:MAG: S9 family peptidase [Deltaproteobacteria bacterium]